MERFSSPVEIQKVNFVLLNGEGSVVKVIGNIKQSNGIKK